MKHKLFLFLMHNDCPERVRYDIFIQIVVQTDYRITCIPLKLKSSTLVSAVHSKTIEWLNEPMDEWKNPDHRGWLGVRKNNRPQNSKIHFVASISAQITQIKLNNYSISWEISDSLVCRLFVFFTHLPFKLNIRELFESTKSIQTIL